MSKRSKSQLIESRAAFEQAIDTIAQQQVSIQTLEADRDVQVEALLLHFNTQIESIRKDIKANMPACMAFAKAHSELMEKGRRSASTPLATYGFRTGMPTVKRIVDDKEDDIAVQLFSKGQTSYVITKHSLNKPAILASLQKGCDALAKLFRVSQGESFYIEAKAQDTK